MQDGADKGENMTFEVERKKKETNMNKDHCYCHKTESTRLSAIW